MNHSSNNIKKPLKRAKELLLERSVRVGGEFKLASGISSDFYVDTKQTSLFPEGAWCLGEAIADAVKDLTFDAIGGPTLGADPLTTAASLALWQRGRDNFGFIVRKEAKGHGTGAWIEGVQALPKGAAVILLEDVVTSGGSSLKAAEKIINAGFSIVSFVCVVDRQEGGRKAIEDAGYSLISLFTQADLRA